MQKCHLPTGSSEIWGCMLLPKQWFNTRNSFNFYSLISHTKTAQFVAAPSQRKRIKMFLLKPSDKVPKSSGFMNQRSIVQVGQNCTNLVPTLVCTFSKCLLNCFIKLVPPPPQFVCCQFEPKQTRFRF